jgi:hypothetical protein
MNNQLYSAEVNEAVKMPIRMTVYRANRKREDHNFKFDVFL